MQKACTAAQFDANPAGCPAASFIGHAKAITPVLPVPLEGPAILRQPRRRSVPQPDRRAAGLRRHDRPRRLDVHQQSRDHELSTFKTVPDAPVGTFELILPEGKYSALAANGNLCKTKAGDADGIRRPERRGNPHHDTDHHHELPKGEEGSEKEEEEEGEPEAQEVNTDAA